jgi:hypothetical protein
LEDQLDNAVNEVVLAIAGQASDDLPVLCWDAEKKAAQLRRLWWRRSDVALYVQGCAHAAPVALARQMLEETASMRAKRSRENSVDIMNACGHAMKALDEMNADTKVYERELIKTVTDACCNPLPTKDLDPSGWAVDGCQSLTRQ